MDQRSLVEIWKSLRRDDDRASARAEGAAWLRSEFGGVINLLAGFHQDWALLNERADDVLAAAARNARKDELQVAIAQMPRLIELVGFARTQVELTSLFLALG